VGSFGLIRGKGKPVLRFLAAIVVLLCVAPAWSVAGDGPGSPASKADDTSPVSAAVDTTTVSAPSGPIIVFGFLGGYVRADDTAHTTVQVARSLRKDYPVGVRIETFENHHVGDAYGWIKYLLGGGRSGTLTEEQKRAARIILYGHSWGASAAVTLARTLQKEGIPVLMTIQVDSVSRSGQNDAVIPDNVRYAANFYQEKGFVHGQPKIQAADASRTQILGNFRMDYTKNPISCEDYPWYTRAIMRSHIEIECDPRVWQRVEDLIREKLPTPVAKSSSTP